MSLQYSHTYMYVNMLMTNIMYCLDAAVQILHVVERDHWVVTIATVVV